MMTLITKKNATSQKATKNPPLPSFPFRSINTFLPPVRSSQPTTTSALLCNTVLTDSIPRAYPSSMAAREPFNVAAKSPMAAPLHSPWHSPVPYLFGGLAAMLGLIAFALLILACSYWRLSGYLEGEGSQERDLEAGEGKSDDAQKTPPIFEEKILVIMAGEVKPTFLATPTSSRSSSFGNSYCSCEGEKNGKAVEMAQTAKPQGGTDVQVPQSENREDHEASADQTH